MGLYKFEFEFEFGRARADHPGAFAVFFCINLAGACSELMLGSYFMELAHQDLRNAGAVQSPAICHKFEGNFDEMEEGISLGTVINLLFKGYLVK